MNDRNLYTKFMDDPLAKAFLYNEALNSNVLRLIPGIHNYNYFELRNLVNRHTRYERKKIPIILFKHVFKQIANFGINTWPSSVGRVISTRNFKTHVEMSEIVTILDEEHKPVVSGLWKTVFINSVMGLADTTLLSVVSLLDESDTNFRNYFTVNRTRPDVPDSPIINYEIHTRPPPETYDFTETVGVAERNQSPIREDHTTPAVDIGEFSIADDHITPSADLRESPIAEDHITPALDVEERVPYSITEDCPATSALGGVSTPYQGQNVTIAEIHIDNYEDNSNKRRHEDEENQIAKRRKVDSPLPQNVMDEINQYDEIPEDPEETLSAPNSEIASDEQNAIDKCRAYDNFIGQTLNEMDDAESSSGVSFDEVNAMDINENISLDLGKESEYANLFV